MEAAEQTTTLEQKVNAFLQERKAKKKKQKYTDKVFVYHKFADPEKESIYGRISQHK